MDPVDLNIVLLGKTGAGKSGSGNTILGETAFESRLSFKSVTTEIQRKSTTIFGKQILVCDTPELFNMQEEENKEIKNLCEEMLQSSIPCLFLVVVKIDRFTGEEQRAVEMAMKILGSAGLEKSYMLFTKGDTLEGKAVQDFIFEDEEGPLRDMVSDKFAGRYHVFNNKDGGQVQVKELLQKSSHLTTNIPSNSLSPDIPRVSNNPQDRKILMLGLPRVGKSESANTILGSHMFDTSVGSASDKCEAKSAKVAGRNITVVDTPGISNENSGTKSHSAQKLYLKTMKSVMECTPGPHAFVIVVRIGTLSNAEIALLDLLPKLYGENALKYAMILFTYGDELNVSLEEFIKANESVSKFVKVCGDRYCIFDNRKGDKNQVGTFLNIIDAMVEANGGQHFNSGIFKVASTAKDEERTISPGPAKNSAWQRVKEWLIRMWHIIAKFFMQFHATLLDFTLRKQMATLANA